MQGELFDLGEESTRKLVRSYRPYYQFTRKLHARHGEHFERNILQLPRSEQYTLNKLWQDYLNTVEELSLYDRRFDLARSLRDRLDDEDAARSSG